MSVNHSARSGGIIGIFFFIFFSMKVCCVFSLELPHRGNSAEYTQHTVMNTIYQRKSSLFVLNINMIMSATMGFFPSNSRMSLK